MRILIASTCVPFVRGGGTKIVDDLQRELIRRGFETETLLIPFDSHWPNIAAQTVALRLLDISADRFDRLIAIRTPAYALQHPNKVAWFIHHHREAYDLWSTPWGGMPDTVVGRHHRDMMRRSDDLYLRECRNVFTNSMIVANRVLEFNGLRPNAVLFPPLPSDHPFRPGSVGDFILYVSRLNAIKRQALAIEAIRFCDPDVKLVIAGTGDEPEYQAKLESLAKELGVRGRVRFTGWIDEAEKAVLTANCRGALYLAFDEDSYGYSTLEAFHAHKPVITLRDSGGSLEVIEHERNGLIAEPNAEAVAAAMNRLWREPAFAEKLGGEAFATLARYGIDWDRVIARLTG